MEGKCRLKKFNTRPSRTDWYRIKLGYSYKQLPNRRKFVQDDPSEEECMAIAGYHSVSPEEFEIMVGDYWNGDVPSPKEFTQAKIDAMILRSIHAVLFDYSEFVDNNDDIHLRSDQDLKFYMVEGRYSRALFLGIKLLHPNQEIFYDFYKALDSDGLTIAIVGRLDDVDKTVLYLGELSGLFP